MLLVYYIIISTGSWQLKPAHRIIEKEFFCCDYDNKDESVLYPLQCGAEYSYGSRLVDYRGNNQHYSPAGSHACLCDEPKQGDNL
eukprot:gene23281-30174_t